MPKPTTHILPNPKLEKHSNMLRRLPIALFILACRKLTGSSSPICDGYCCTKAPATNSGFFVRQRLHFRLPHLPVRLIRSRKP